MESLIDGDTRRDTELKSADGSRLDESQKRRTPYRLITGTFHFGRAITANRYLMAGTLGSLSRAATRMFTTSHRRVVEPRWAS